MRLDWGKVRALSIIFSKLFSFSPYTLSAQEDQQERQSYVYISLLNHRSIASCIAPPPLRAFQQIQCVLICSSSSKRSQTYKNRNDITWYQEAHILMILSLKRYGSWMHGRIFSNLHMWRFADNLKIKQRFADHRKLFLPSSFKKHGYKRGRKRIVWITLWLERETPWLSSALAPLSFSSV